jgi:hypothetical protein
MAAVAAGSRKGVTAIALVFVWFGIGIALLAGSALAFYSSTKNDAVVAYNSAPACATFDDAVAGKSCIYTITAQVTQVGGDTSTTEIDFQIPGQSIPYYQAKLPGTATSLRPGDQVQVEFWGLKVTRLDGAPTTNNPASDTPPRTLQVIGALLLLLAVGATGAGIVAARRRQGHAASPTMSPVAMSDVLWR